MIVALTGYARSGKDSVGDSLCGRHGFHRASFAHRLKAMALELDPILEVEADEFTEPYHARLSQIIECCGSLDKAKEIPEVRRFLQDFGMGARRHLGLNVWVDAAIAHLDPHDDIVVTDCRFRNEAEAVKAKRGVIVRVTRPGVGAVNAHQSEHDLADWPVDAVIANEGTLDDLDRQVDDLLRNLRQCRARALQAAGPDEFPTGFYDHLAEEGH